jgi:hypothetical protein
LDERKNHDMTLDDDDDTVRPLVFREYGPADPYVNTTHRGEKHTLAQMPARLVYTLVGWCIELGPYTFDRDDIEVLREAIAGYDQVNPTGSWG